MISNIYSVCKHFPGGKQVTKHMILFKKKKFGYFILKVRDDLHSANTKAHGPNAEAPNEQILSN